QRLADDLRADALASRVPDDAGAGRDTAREQLLAAQADVHPDVVPIHLLLLRQPKGGDVAGHRGDDAGQLARARQHADAAADGEQVASRERALPGLAVGEPEEAVLVDRPDQVAQLVGVGDQQDPRPRAAGPPDEVPGPRPLDAGTSVAPEALDKVEDQVLLRGRPSQVAEPLDEVEHTCSLSRRGMSEEARA